MLEKVLGALLPAIITILLGYFAARHHDFSQKEVPTLSRMVMSYALPLSLFVGVVSAGRKELLADLPLAAFLAGAIVGMYVLILALAVFVFRHPLGLSSLRALTAAAPSTAFVGMPVMGYLYGASGDVPIAVGSIIIVVCLVPTTLILLAIDAHAASASEPPAAGAVAGTGIAPKGRRGRQDHGGSKTAHSLVAASRLRPRGSECRSPKIYRQFSFTAWKCLRGCGAIYLWDHPRRLQDHVERAGLSPGVYQECCAARARLCGHALAGLRQSTFGADGDDDRAPGGHAGRYARRSVSHCDS